MQMVVLDPLMSHSVAKPGGDAFRMEANRQTLVAGTSRATSPGLLNATDHPQGLQEVSSRHFRLELRRSDGLGHQDHPDKK